MIYRHMIAVLAVTGFATAANAVDFADPTWPCIQRKVERLSIGLMWPHPIGEITLPEDVKADAMDLVQRFRLRRLELSDIQPVLDTFVETHKVDETVLGHIFAEVFDDLSGTRTIIINGIGEYSLSQIALSETISAERTELTELMRSDKPDFDRVDAVEEKLDWNERIFTERAQSLTYICETPVLLEKRLYAIAQMLLAKVGQ